MDIFCEKCQKKVGKIADEKIPSGKKLSVSCPKCGDKIHFEKPEKVYEEIDFSPDVDSVSSEPAVDGESALSPPSGVVRDYDFSIMDIIREAWAKTSGAKGPVWGALVLGILAVIVFSFTVGLVSGIIGSGPLTAGLNGAAQLTITIAGYPFMAGLALIGIRRATDLPVDYKMAFNCYRMMLPIVLASILTSIFTFLGYILLIIPGIYLSIAYLLVLQLIVDREMTFWEAMEVSRKGIQRHWFKVFGLYLFMGLICLVSAIPMGIGLVWTIPMFIVVGGILYREVFGVTQEI